MSSKDRQAPLLEQDDWLLTDEDLMAALRREEALRPLIADLDRGAGLPEASVEFETDHKIGRPDLMRHRDTLFDTLSEIDDNLYVTLIPYGEALERTVTFLDPRTNQAWSVGAPKRVYRLHVHYGGANGRTRFNSTNKKVQGKIDQHADSAGWRIRSRSEAAAA
jgi:hypothetical protein